MKRIKFTIDDCLLQEARDSFAWLAEQPFDEQHRQVLRTFLYCMGKTEARLEESMKRRRVSQEEVTRRVCFRAIGTAQALRGLRGLTQ